MVVLEHLQGIIRANGGDLSYGADSQLEGLLSSGAKVANRWVMVPSSVIVTNLELSEDLRTRTYALVGMWRSGFGKPEHTEAILERIETIVHEIETTGLPADICALTLDPETQIEWDGQALTASQTVTTTTRRA